MTSETTPTPTTAAATATTAATATPQPAPSARRRTAPWLAAAVVALSAALLAGCSGGSSASGQGGAGTRPATTATTSSLASTPTTPTAVAPTTGATSSGGASATPSPSGPKRADARAEHVHISLFNGDGAHYGVGMPVIAYFSRQITDGAALQQATTVTADGKPLAGAWYFENSGAGNGPIEGHFRPRHYWPAHARIHVAIPAKGLSAGKGLGYDDSLTLDFSTGARNVAKVDDGKHTLTLTSDGKRVGRFPVSLGGPGSRTIRGTKVVMEQDQDTRMRGAHSGIEYNLAHVYWTQRLTYSGEYLHAAPWNEASAGGNIGRSNSSNGCTNLSTADAKKLFGLMQVGDVVRYPDAGGAKMRLGDGYGDWNLTWAQWRTGGLVSTS
ncbi:Lipoprotein-anchoring transpeptidase ErfK/SrfK [Jatrophihabitans endophyticus]|uniref:Lipoprotein-anchoring transpeptidase ErfK/SrfK n=1 Tax=Jatrophihabitans endophyticus TaxID=1206085 RepID=A0A1M5H1G8_9ACTN|nr:L,D-transpeptidase [Jatrophihabitans endophyticus]SHG09780.1 Lipoprotein-anchoring transpeptidase ErfK/SrfK [Jatrophihabitans endophyticus]